MHVVKSNHTVTDSTSHSNFNTFVILLFI